MTLIKDIGEKDWALSLLGQGEIVTDDADIEQCISIILNTDRGSDPMRPEFGNNIFRLLDKPVTVAIGLIVKEISDSILIWETRALLDKVQYKLNGSSVEFFVQCTTLDGRPLNAVKFEKQFTYGI